MSGRDRAWNNWGRPRWQFTPAHISNEFKMSTGHHGSTEQCFSAGFLHATDMTGRARKTKKPHFSMLCKPKHRGNKHSLFFKQDSTTAAATEPLLTEDVHEVASTMTNNRSLHPLALNLQQGSKPLSLGKAVIYRHRI